MGSVIRSEPVSESPKGFFSSTCAWTDPAPAGNTGVSSAKLEVSSSTCDSTFSSTSGVVVTATRVR